MLLLNGSDTEAQTQILYGLLNWFLYIKGSNFLKVKWFTIWMGNNFNGINIPFFWIWIKLLSAVFCVRIEMSMKVNFL